MSITRWIGLSVLSVAELAELVYRLIRHYFEELKTRRKIGGVQRGLLCPKVKMTFDFFVTYIIYRYQ